MKRLLAVLLISLFCLASIKVGNSFASEVDILVQKLVDKGILTGPEAQQVLADTRTEVKKQIAKGEYDMLPQWLQNIKMKGDLRVRFEDQVFPGTQAGTQDRIRTRLRLRFGFDAKINDEIYGVFRLAGGTVGANGPEQTSTNTTFEKGFNGKSIYIDQAFIAYTPKLTNMSLKVTAGKMINPFYTTDMMWDPDITPEGAAFMFEKPFNDNFKIFVNAGAFPTFESSSQYDEPVIIGGQGGIAGKVFAKDYKVAVTGYDFTNIKNYTPATIFPGKNFGSTPTTTGNTQNAAGNYKYGFKIMEVNAEITPTSFKILGVDQPFKIFGQFLGNYATANIPNNKAYLVGFQLGKASDPKTWDFNYTYRLIGQDANCAEIIDSDFHGGGVNSKGSKFILNYVLSKNTTLSLTFFNTRQDKGTKIYNNTIQVDCLVKF